MPTKVRKMAVKKVVKKIAVKKSPKVTAKKVATKKTTNKKPLVYAKNEQSFWTKDGQIFNSLVVLETGLSKMNKSVFSHHVTKDRNDFAIWIDTVLGDKTCATELSKAKTASSAAKVVAKNLKNYHF